MAAAREPLVGSRQRRAASEGSLSLTVAGSLDNEQSRRGGKGRGEQERAEKGGGGGSGNFARGNQEGIRRRDLEGGGGGMSGHVGKSNVAGTTDGPRIVHVMQ